MLHNFSVDLNMGCSALPQIITTVTQLWLSQKMEVATAATYALEILLKDCMSAICATPELVQQHSSKLSKCFGTLEMGLSYQYHNVWHQVLHVIKVMFEVSPTLKKIIKLGIDCFSITTPILQ